MHGSELSMLLEKNIAFRPESQTDKEIKTIKNIDYTVEVVAEKIDKTAKTLSTSKVSVSS